MSTALRKYKIEEKNPCSPSITVALIESKLLGCVEKLITGTTSNDLTAVY